MADAYIYQADIYCEDCANDIRSKLSPKLLALADDDGNSEMAPQGPFCDGGGEPDCPQHCGRCMTFLENPLTGDGYNYVREMASDPTSHSDVVKEWMDYYDLGE